MSGTVSTRWFWSDWLSEPTLRACGYAARGLWKDLLCIAGSNKEKEYGYVTLNGRPLDLGEIARMTGGAAAEVKTLVDELEHNGVFSRDRRKAIYCRRMVRAQKFRENGRTGGNPDVRRGTVPKEKRVKRRSFSPADRQRLFDEADGKCKWCKCEILLRWSGKGDVPLNLMHVDHIIAICDGGTNDWENLVASCRSCNGERAMVINSGNHYEKGEAGGAPLPLPEPEPEPKTPKKENVLSDWPPDYQQQFWSRYPRKVEKKAAMAKLDQVRRTSLPWVVLIGGVDRYALFVAGSEERFIKHPTVWLNKGCWDDQSTAPRGPSPPPNRPGGLMAAARALRAFNAEEDQNGADASGVDERPALPAPSVT